jgi:hypothetical protein
MGWFKKKNSSDLKDTWRAQEKGEYAQAYHQERMKYAHEKARTDARSGGGSALSRLGKMFGGMDGENKKRYASRNSRPKSKYVVIKGRAYKTESTRRSSARPKRRDVDKSMSDLINWKP